MKSNTFNQVILRGLNHFERSSFENIVEINLCHLTSNNSYSVNLLRNIFINGLFRYGVNAGHKVINLNFTAICSLNGFIYTVTADGKANAVNLSVLTCFYDLARTVADFHLNKAFYRVADFLCI